MKTFHNFYGDIIAVFDDVNQKLTIYADKLKGITIVIETEKEEKE